MGSSWGSISLTSQPESKASIPSMMEMALQVIASPESLLQIKKLVDLYSSLDDSQKQMAMECVKSIQHLQELFESGQLELILGSLLDKATAKLDAFVESGQMEDFMIAKLNESKERKRKRATVDSVTVALTSCQPPVEAPPSKKHMSLQTDGHAETVQ